MLIALHAAKVTSSSISWNWTAIGTVALAVLTFATLLYTVLATRRDRAQAKADRQDAEKRLDAERKAGDERVEAERKYAEKVRRRDRQIANVAALAGRVAGTQAHLAAIPGAVHRIGQGGQTTKDALAAIWSLRLGAWTEAAMLGTDKTAEAAADRYRALVALLGEASNAQLANRYPERDMDTLRNYVRWVLISLSNLAEDETVPTLAPGFPEIPLLGLAEDMPAWLPDPIPAEWDDMARADVPVRKSPQGMFGGGHKINSQGEATGALPG